MTEQPAAAAAPVRPPGASPSARPITSVGIDIGSATTKIMVSRLWLDVAGQLVTSATRIVAREVLFASPLHLTPFATNGVDARAVRVLVDRAYLDAGVEAAQVETGALIVTGEAARQENATAVAEAVADLAGVFVCVAAGPRLEGRLAAYGAGAVDLSAERVGQTLLHVDIGGATTKLVVLRDGEIVDAAAANVGGRMLTLEGDRVAGITPALRRLLRAAGVELDLGAPAPAEVRSAVAGLLADDLLGFVLGEPRPADDVMDEPVTPPLRGHQRFDAVSYSGGVAAYVYGEHNERYGDLGPELADAVRARLEGVAGETLRPARTIRATVVGASQFNTQVSGTTTHLSPGLVLPVTGLRVVPMVVPAAPFSADDVRLLAEGAREQLDLTGQEATVLAIRWSGEPSYSRLAALAAGVDAAVRSTPKTPLVVAIDRDLGGAFGALLAAHRAPQHVLCVDEVTLHELDVVDVGAPVGQPMVLPVTVRSVEFA